MKDTWNINYDWDLVNNTWLRVERLQPYWSGVTYIPDNYFKYQKCLSGITYQYVNKLDDIYTKNDMVGKTWCIYDMYNEFDIINNFMVNIDTVDVVSTTNLDLAQRYYTIDNAYLKTKHKVVLVNQTNKAENTLYTVDSRGYLIASQTMANSGNTFRYKAYIKLGDHRHSEWHLMDNGGVFPVLYQNSDYMSGKTYIIKHFFSYNINASNPVPKLIFTDYDIARHINPLNYELYSGFTLPTLNNGDVVTIKYHDYSGYTITLSVTTTNFIYTDTVSGTTFHWGTFINGLPSYENGFMVECGTNFYNSSKEGDYVKIEFSGNTNLVYYTTIYYKDSGLPTTLILRDPIPQNVLNDFFSSGGTTYTITNLQWSTVSNLQNILNESYYARYFSVDSSLYVSPIYNTYNHYFDYDGLGFIFSTSPTEYTFPTSNYYIKYKLYEQLNAINSSVFTNSYTFVKYPDTSLTSFTTGLTSFNDVQSSEYYGSYPKGTYIKITPTNPNDILLFRKNTFVNLNSIYKTLIVDCKNDYFIIETYKSNSGLTLTNIDTIYNLTGISDLLYTVYKNDENDWYMERDDDLRKSICIAYSRIIEDDPNITKYCTGLLTQDDKHKFILELYNPESLYNNGGNVTVSYDSNLVYKPIELIEIGVDKHTKIPIPILNENLVITYDLITGTTTTTSGTTTGSTSYNWFSFNISSGLFSIILVSNNPTTLTVDWGDGSSENISFNGYWMKTHTYMVDADYTVKFSGDLQYIIGVSVENNFVKSANLKNITNIIKITLDNNELTDLDITGLIYLKGLVLTNNNLVETDKFFNLLDYNGLFGGVIETAGGSNASVTSLSQPARNNLVAKTWSLAYN